MLRGPPHILNIGYGRISRRGKRSLMHAHDRGNGKFITRSLTPRVTKPGCTSGWKPRQDQESFREARDPSSTSEKEIERHVRLVTNRCPPSFHSRNYSMNNEVEIDFAKSRSYHPLTFYEVNPYFHRGRDAKNESFIF